MEQIKEELHKVVDEAQARIEIEAAHNPALRQAIHIVEDFLHRTGRVCYGGQAINAQLPVKDRFYDSDRSLPDYDFFSPDAKKDMEDLIDGFKAAGYTEISKRYGIHEGTSKLYVNFAPIADITQMIPEFYETIFRKSRVVDRVHYADPVFLRMMMYLELSRPRGEVERWEKVYERLVLLDRANPMPKCTTNKGHLKAASHVMEARPALVRYIVKNHRVFMGADLDALYRRAHTRPSRMRFLLPSSTTRTKTKANILSSTPVIFLSPDAALDADELAPILGVRKVAIPGYQNILPAMVGLYHDDSLVGLIVQEEACHSIVTLPLTKQRYLRVASLETALTFLIGLYYREDMKDFGAEESILCLVKQYIDLSHKYKTRPTKLIPAFPIECSGYQTTFASLLRAKVARIEAERQRVSSGKTRRLRSLSQRRQSAYLDQKDP